VYTYRDSVFAAVMNSDKISIGNLKPMKNSDYLNNIQLYFILK